MNDALQVGLIVSSTGFPLGSFDREDEMPDERFYIVPRLVVHMDDGAIGALRRYLRRELLPHGDVLDLMSSWRSHLPEDIPLSRVVGVGLNEVELAENPQLTEYQVHDLNLDPSLPFEDAEFDSVLLTVSVQYLVRPLEVFQEAGRVLRGGGQFTISFSNRMFPTKAVRVWREGGDREHVLLVHEYFRMAGGFEDIRTVVKPPSEAFSDPLFIVAGRRAGV